MVLFHLLSCVHSRTNLWSMKDWFSTLWKGTLFSLLSSWWDLELHACVICADISGWCAVEFTVFLYMCLVFIWICFTHSVCREWWLKGASAYNFEVWFSKCNFRCLLLSFYASILVGWRTQLVGWGRAYWWQRSGWLHKAVQSKCEFRMHVVFRKSVFMCVFPADYIPGSYGHVL